jgi:hypothetical protein
LKNNDTLLAAIQANSKAKDALKMIIQKVAKPLADTMAVLVATAKEEQGSKTAIISPFVRIADIDNFDKSYSDILDIGTKLGISKGWTKYQVAKWCAVGVGAVALGYLCYQNKDAIMQKVGSITIPSRAEFTEMAKAAPGKIVQGIKNTPGAIKGTAVYVGTQVAGAAQTAYGFVPSLEATKNAIKNAPSAAVAMAGTVLSAGAAQAKKAVKYFGQLFYKDKAGHLVSVEQNTGNAIVIRPSEQQQMEQDIKDATGVTPPVVSDAPVAQTVEEGYQQAMNITTAAINTPAATQEFVGQQTPGAQPSPGEPLLQGGIPAELALENNPFYEAPAGQQGTQGELKPTVTNVPPQQTPANNPFVEKTTTTTVIP